MVHGIRSRLWVAALLLVACSAEGANSDVRSVPQATLGDTQAQPTPADGQASPPGDYGNSSFQPSAQAGAAAAVPVAAGAASLADCTGGLYLGTYDCELDIFGLKGPLTGDVSFALEIDTTVVEGECDTEFCPDLVIAEGSGTLFGLAVGWGFEAQLEGGLDCSTGEFRAEAPDGVYGAAGSSDPTDPNALWTVLDPALGTFTGSMSGQHAQGSAERIEGEWNLLEPAAGIRCIGPFRVSLQP